MSNKTKTVWKVFLAWQDEKEAQWLSEMAAQGWLLVECIFVKYTFVKSEPVDVIYKLDYHHLKGNEYYDYFTLFKDCGWEHITSLLGWHYFMTQADNCKVPDIYSDYSSQAEKYKRLLWVLVPLLFMLITISISVVFNPVYDRVTIMQLFKVLYIILISIFCYACYTIYKRIQNLKSNI